MVWVSVQGQAHAAGAFCTTLAAAVSETRALASALAALAAGVQQGPSAGAEQQAAADALATSKLAPYCESYWVNEVAALVGVLAANLCPLEAESAAALKQRQSQADNGRGWRTKAEAELAASSKSAAGRLALLHRVELENDERLERVRTEVAAAVEGLAASVGRSEQLCSPGAEEEQAEKLLTLFGLFDDALGHYLKAILEVARGRAGPQPLGGSGGGGVTRAVTDTLWGGGRAAEAEGERGQRWQRAQRWHPLAIVELAAWLVAAYPSLGEPDGSTKGSGLLVSGVTPTAHVAAHCADRRQQFRQQSEVQV